MRAKSAIGLAACLLLAAGAEAAPQKGSCVECHKGLPAAVTASHDFTDWRKSPHAAAGVSCEACHGGDASTKDKSAAHKGILRSSDAGSGIYFTKVPATCGSCHAAEFKAFQQSAHFQELQSSGKGPNCVTCHGSMANVVLGPRELETTCALCHRQPTQAFAARHELDSTGAMVRGLGSVLKKAHADAAADLGSADKAYREIIDLQGASAVQWHTFKMADVLAANREVQRRVTTLLGELKRTSPASKPK